MWPLPRPREHQSSATLLSQLGRGQQHGKARTHPARSDSQALGQKTGIWASRSQFSSSLQAGGQGKTPNTPSMSMVSPCFPHLALPFALRHSKLLFLQKQNTYKGGTHQSVTTLARLQPEPPSIYHLNIPDQKKSTWENSASTMCWVSDDHVLYSLCFVLFFSSSEWPSF